MADSLYQRLNQFIEVHQLIKPGSTIIVGLSGGPDSVFLLHFLVCISQKYNLKVIAAHLDHGWRTNSASDMLFCQQLAATINIPFTGARLDELPITLKSNGSKEELGRKARRFFLQQVAHEFKADAIALGHHADDQQETFFIRLLRGASLSGLIGMKPQEELYIRPLLETKKSDIHAYLHEYRIPFCVDTSNESNEYLRNRIRNQVIPALKNVDARWDNSFAATHAQLQETEDFLQQLAQQTLAQLTELHHGIKIDALLGLHSVLQKRVLLAWLIAHKVTFVPSKNLLEEIIRFLRQPGKGTHTLYGSWQIIKEAGMVTITAANRS